MLDYCGEEEFYPIDGDNDNYYAYTPNLSGVEFARRYNKSSTFVTDRGYYDDCVLFDRVIERTTCYSILKDNVWMNIPKKIVRDIDDNEMLVYRPIFNKIYAKALKKSHTQYGEENE